MYYVLLTLKRHVEVILNGKKGFSNIKRCVGSSLPLLSSVWGPCLIFEQNRKHTLIFEIVSVAHILPIILIDLTFSYEPATSFTCNLLKP